MGSDGDEASSGEDVAGRIAAKYRRKLKPRPRPATAKSASEATDDDAPPSSDDDGQPNSYWKNYKPAPKRQSPQRSVLRDPQQRSTRRHPRTVQWDPDERGRGPPPRLAQRDLDERLTQKDPDARYAPPSGSTRRDRPRRQRDSDESSVERDTKREIDQRMRNIDKVLNYLQNPDGPRRRSASPKSRRRTDDRRSKSSNPNSRGSRPRSSSELESSDPDVIVERYLINREMKAKR